jgi:hypothetical protein
MIARATPSIRINPPNRVREIPLLLFMKKAPSRARSIPRTITSSSVEKADA